MKGLTINDRGRPTIHGPGKLEGASLEAYRATHRVRKLVFEIATSLTKDYAAQPSCQVPTHALFKQLVPIVQRYLDEKVRVVPPGDLRDVSLAPYYGWVVEVLVQALRPDVGSGETPEIPRYEPSRPAGSTADVSFWTSRDVREVEHSHLNFAVADPQRWEQSATYYIDTNSMVDAFVKNSGLGFAIPYLDNGQMHDYIPDFVLRLKTAPPVHLILETKGYDPKEDKKVAAAYRWVDAVNADGRYGRWAYTLAKKPGDIPALIVEASKP